MSTPFESLNEQELIFHLKRGHSKAFRYLMQTFYPVLFHFTSGFVVDSALAEDIAEEAFIELWHRHTAFESLPAIRKFLLVTAQRDCLDAIRKQGREEKKLAGMAETMNVQEDNYALLRIIHAEVLADIYQAIEALPDKMKQVFKLSYIDGYKNDEIAEQLQLSSQTVRNQKSRALELLRLRFKDKETFMLALLLAFY